MKIIFATSNQNKVKEVNQILEGLSVTFISLKELDDHDDVIEDGNTFEENAFIKAKYFFDKYKIPVVSEDSGICCDGLNGQPGIFSARYSGLGDEGNNDKLIRELIGKDKNAHYYCAVCFIDDTGKAHYFNGKVFGKIISERIGNNGFGYDPIFLSDELNITFGQADSEAKNKISHRYRAFMKFKDFLLNSDKK